MNAEAPPTVEAELREARARLELRALRAREKVIERAERRLQESWDPWFTTGRDVRALDQVRLSTGQHLGAHVSTAADRRYGNYAPFWRTWYEHSRLRAAARLVYGLSPLCSGAVRGLRSYCVGEGFTYQAVGRKGRDAPKELIEAVQDVIEDFDRRNCWTGREARPGRQAQESWEGEAFTRSVVDGEVGLREYEPDPGRLVVRPVEPEWIIEPPGLREEVSYGVITDPDDLCTVEGYFIAIDGNTGSGEIAPVAGEGPDGVHFLKRNTPRTVKRGLSDLAYGTHDALRSAGRLLENLAEGTAVQASLALLRRHTGTPKDVVQEFADSLASYDRPNVYTGGTDNVEPALPGRILDVPDSISFDLPSFGANQGAFISVVQAVLRSVAVKWNAPEWLTSGDASNNNYASSLTAESPFVKGMKSEQRTIYAPFFLGVVWRAVEVAARAGLVATPDGRVWDWREVKRLVDVNCTPPTVETRNRGEEATTNQVYVGMGVKSPQTVQAEQGLDPDQEMAQIEEWRRRFGSGGAQVPDQGDQGGGFFGVQESRRLREAEERTDKAEDAPAGEPPDIDLGAVADILAHVFGEDEALRLLAAQPQQESRQRELFPLLEAGFSGEKKDKLGRRMCYRDGKRVPCPKAEKAQKAAKKTIDDARAQIKQAQADPTPRGAFDLANTLAGLTVADLAALKKELGVRGGGRRKAELMAALRDRLFPEGAAPAPEPAAEPKAAPGKAAPSDPKEFGRQLYALGDEVTRGFGPDKVLIGDVFAKAREKWPGLTREEFDARIEAARVAGSVQLSRMDLPQLFSDEDVEAARVPNPVLGNREPYFLRVKPAVRSDVRTDGGPPAPKAEPAPAPEPEAPPADRRGYLRQISAASREVPAGTLRDVEGAARRLAAGDNLADMADLRRAVPGLSREEFHAAVWRLIADGVLTGGAREGRDVATPEQMAADIPASDPASANVGYVKVAAP